MFKFALRKQEMQDLVKLSCYRRFSNNGGLCIVPLLKCIQNSPHVSMACRRCVYTQNESILLTQMHHNAALYKCSNHMQNDCAREFSTTFGVLAKSKDRGQNKKKKKAEHIDLQELSTIVNVEKLIAQYDHAIDKLKENFIKHLSIRTAAGSLEELPVTFEGKNFVLQDLTEISRTPKLVVLDVSTFPQAIPNILQSLRDSQMCLNPQQDGTKIFITLAKVTKEHRESMCKSAKSLFIKSRDEIKNVRNQYVKKVKDMTDQPVDLVFRVEGYIDTFADDYIGKAEKLLDAKQKELLGELR